VLESSPVTRSRLTFGPTTASCCQDFPSRANSMAKLIDLVELSFYFILASCKNREDPREADDLIRLRSRAGSFPRKHLAAF